MSSSETAWTQAAPILRAIEQHPFIAELVSGTLPADRFHYYMLQDALYLADYGRALALAGSQAPLADEVQFWSAAATRATAVERQLHRQLVANLEGGRPSPSGTADTSCLLALGAHGVYALLVTGVLPCYWIYEHVGSVLARRVEDVDEHPYRAWIDTCADPDFAAASAQARAIADRAVAAAHDDERATIVFFTACRYEWMFWDTAWHMEQWPV